MSSPAAPATSRKPETRAPKADHLTILSGRRNAGLEHPTERELPRDREPALMASPAWHKGLVVALAWHRGLVASPAWHKEQVAALAWHKGLVVALAWHDHLASDRTPAERDQVMARAMQGAEPQGLEAALAWHWHLALDRTPVEQAAVTARAVQGAKQDPILPSGRS